MSSRHDGLRVIDLPLDDMVDECKMSVRRCAEDNNAVEKGGKGWTMWGLRGDYWREGAGKHLKPANTSYLSSHKRSEIDV